MRKPLTNGIRRIPILGDWAAQIYRWATRRQGDNQSFQGSQRYWERRYERGGNSGLGSYGNLAAFKAEVLNNFVTQHHVRSVIEFGCGDGNQLSLANYPRYTGFDISETAISLCKRRFASDTSKVFKNLWEYAGETAELALSLDVIYHLVEDELFHEHMNILFSASEQYVAIYSSDCDDNESMEGTHVRHRKFTTWIRDNALLWRLLHRIPNRHPYQAGSGSWSDLFIYEKKQPTNHSSSYTPIYS